MANASNYNIDCPDGTYPEMNLAVWPKYVHMHFLLINIGKSEKKNYPGIDSFRVRMQLLANSSLSLLRSEEC